MATASDNVFILFEGCDIRVYCASGVTRDADALVRGRFGTNRVIMVCFVGTARFVLSNIIAHYALRIVSRVFVGFSVCD